MALEKFYRALDSYMSFHNPLISCGTLFKSFNLNMFKCPGRVKTDWRYISPMLDTEKYKPNPWIQKAANIYARTVIRILLIMKSVFEKVYNYLDSKV